MKAACDLAQKYKRPVVLGDQRINISVQSMGDGFKETISHVINPVSGWSKLATSLNTARRRALPLGDDDNLNFQSLLDLKLFAVAPVSLPISFFPSLFFLDQYTGNVRLAEMTAVDWLGSLGFAALETGLFARVILKELLADRYEVIARNILEQSKLYQPKSGWNILSSWMRGKRVSEVVYVDGINVLT
jgi:hypothetical protein